MSRIVEVKKKWHPDFYLPDIAHAGRSFFDLVYDSSLPVQSQMRQLEGETRSNGPQLLFRNMALDNVPIQDAENALMELKGIAQPIRTGHLGSAWELLQIGAGESVTFNMPVVQLGLGKPFLADHTQTPATNGHGDFLYWPGSIQNNGWVTHLQLYSLQGRELKRQNRSTPLFSPFVYADYRWHRAPLSQIHRSRLKKLSLQEKPVYLSNFLLERWSEVEDILTASFTQIKTMDEAQRNQIINNVFTSIQLNGTIAYPNLGLNGDIFSLSRKSMNQKEFLEFLHFTTMVVSGGIEPIKLLREYGEIATYFSSDYLLFLAAYLNADAKNGNRNKTPVRPHLHMGGYQMAGVPPFVNGYIERGDKRRLYNDFASLLKYAETGSHSTYILLFPATIYNLLPHAAYEYEIEAVTQLINRILTCGSPLRGKREHTEKVAHLTSDWFGEQINELSGPYLSRFDKTSNTIRKQYQKSSVKSSVYPPQTPNLIVPERFGELTLKEASIIVGYLMSLL